MIRWWVFTPTFYIFNKSLARICMNTHPSLTRLILLGITSGILLSHDSHAENQKNLKNGLKQLLESVDDESSGNMGYHLMTEEELLLQLNDEGAKLYESLTPEGKTLALEVASQRCAATNSCKGLNACRTDKNACAGKGQCKNLGKCAISDPNVAVKLTAKKMADKRQQTQR